MLTADVEQMSAALAEPIRDPSLPIAIGPYRIIDVLGEGGMGVVYRAVKSAGTDGGRAAAPGKIVALKTVRVPEGSSVASIRAEIIALSRLRHPFIVQILGEGVADGIPWYAMELLDGVTMRGYHRTLWSGVGAIEHADTMVPGQLGPEAPTQQRLSPTPGADAPTWRSTSAVVEREQPYVPRRSAPRRLTAGGRLHEVLTLMRRLCAPLAYLHGRGIVHRDLKPGNVSIRPNGEPVLMDFGLASQFRGGLGRETLEIGGLLVGTASYMAPEQAMGLLVDARADLYAFGVLLYEMLTGSVPFVGRTVHELLQQHCSEPPEPPSRLVDGVSERLDALVLRLLAKRPRDRFGYAEDVAAALAELGADPSPEVRSRTYLYRAELSGRDEAVATLQQAIDRLRAGAGGRVFIGGESGVGKTSLASRAASKATLARITVITGECLPIAVASGSMRDRAVDSEPPLSKGAVAADARPASKLTASAEPRLTHRPPAGADSQPSKRPGGVEPPPLSKRPASTEPLASKRAAGTEPLPPSSKWTGGAAAHHISSLNALDVKGAPLHPFHTLLQRIADFCREGGRERTDKLLGRRGKVLAAYEPAIADLPGQSEQPALPELSVEAAHQRLLEALADTLAAFVSHAGPILLIIDDLQWADELSLSFLASLPAEYFARQPLLLLATYRADEVGMSLGHLLERCADDNIQLGRLDERTVGAIVSDMLALPSPPDRFVRFLSRQSEGNPFFVAEYLRAAVEEGFLRREEGAWRFATEIGANDGDDGLAPSDAGAWTGPSSDALPLALPLSLRELVARRLMGLGDDARTLLEVASVLGREVEAALLMRVAGVSESAALDALKELALRQVLLPTDGDRRRFAHDKLREITYARIPGDRRRALHKAAAEEIERELSSSTHLARHFSQLAHHWTAAEVWSKAMRYLEKAGEQALRDFSNREATRFFRQAIALSGRLDEQPGPLALARWERSLVEAHFGLGEDAKGLEHAERALRHCRLPVPASPAGRFFGFIAQIVIRIVQSWIPPRKVTSPVKRALLLEAAYVSQRMIEPAFRDNDPVLGTYCGMRCLNLAEHGPVSPPLARGYAFLSHVLGLTPLQGVARSWSEKALRYAEELHSEPLLIYCLSRVGSYSTAVAAWDRAEAQLGRAIEMARKLGDRRQLDEGLALLGICLHANGRFAESVASAKEAFSSANTAGDLQTQGWARNYMAQSLTRLGRHTEALAVLDTGRSWLESGGAEATEALWAEAAEALALHAAGELEPARRAADAALARLKERPPAQFYLGATCAEIAEVYLSLWEDAAGSERAAPLAEAARAAEKILYRFSKSLIFMRPGALRTRAGVAWMDGAEAKALKLWRRALAEAERLTMPYEQARAHLDLGLHLESHADAAAHLERAIALLTPLRAANDLVRARAALGEIRG